MHVCLIPVIITSADFCMFFERKMTVHEKLWEQLLKLDPHVTAKRAKCGYLEGSSQYCVKFLDSEYMVDIAEKRIFSDTGEAEPAGAGFMQQLCILAYLINSADVLLSGKLVTGDKLEAGQFFFRGPHAIPTEKLEDVFGTSPDMIYSALAGLDAKKASFGDVSVEIAVLPRLPMTFIIWGSDDEFPARASILFDKTATQQMPLDALFSAVNLTVKALVSAV